MRNGTPVTAYPKLLSTVEFREKDVQSSRDARPLDYVKRTGCWKGCTFFTHKMIPLNLVLPRLRGETQIGFSQDLGPGLWFEIPCLVNPHMLEGLVRGHAQRRFPPTYQQSPAHVSVLLFNAETFSKLQ